MPKTTIVALGCGVVLYVLLCVALYFKQENLLFFPERLPADYQFSFSSRFEERWTTTPDGTRLHGLLFKTASASKGLIFYLQATAAPSTTGAT